MRMGIMQALCATALTAATAFYGAQQAYATSEKSAPPPATIKKQSNLPLRPSFDLDGLYPFEMMTLPNDRFLGDLKSEKSA